MKKYHMPEVFKKSDPQDAINLKKVIDYNDRVMRNIVMEKAKKDAFIKNHSNVTVEVSPSLRQFAR